MKILVVSNMYPSKSSPVFGGFVQRQVEALRRAGVEVELAVNTISATGLAVNAVKYAALSRRARRAARADLDLVHGHYLYPTAVIAERAASGAGRPLVLTAHGDDVDNAANSRLAGRIKRALDRAQAVVCVSEYLAARLMERFGTPREKIHVIDCGVDTELFHPMDRKDARLLADLPEGARVVLFAAHLREAKGVRTMLAAHERLVAERDDVLLAVAGDGPLAGEVEKAAREGRMRGKIRVLGEVSHYRMGVYYAAVDVVCVTSEREGFGLVALESLASGTPVVASDVGGLPEIVTEGLAGRLVPPSDPDAVAKAVLGLLQHRPAGLADAAARLTSEHSLERVTERLVSLYRSLIA